MFEIDDDIMAQLRATFQVEADEHIQAMNSILLELERDDADEQRRIELLEGIFREAHSLKGAAGAADLSSVEATGHKLESILAGTKSGELDLSTELCDLLYEAIDAVSLLVTTSLEGSEHNLDLDDLFRRLDAAKQGEIESPFRMAAPAETAPEPVADAPAPPPATEPALQKPAPQKPAPIDVLVQPAPAESTTPPPPSVPLATDVAPAASASAERPAPAAQPAVTSAPAPAPKKPATPPTKPRAAQPSAAKDRARTAAAQAEETIRVATTKLDSLLTQTGELLVAKLRVDERAGEVGELAASINSFNRKWSQARELAVHSLRDKTGVDSERLLELVASAAEELRDMQTQLADLSRGFSRDAVQLSRVTADLGEGVMKLRMLPVSTVFDTYPRLVRDLCRHLGKKIDLQIEGNNTELDRKVLEEIKDPLLHLVRNAVDHGIENPDERAAAGKNAIGTITLRAQQKGSSIVIEVQDDGGGIDADRVKAKAVANGTISAQEAEMMSDDEARRLIFSSGLSTKEEVTDVSGRGVGMDVVRRNIEALHGQVDLESEMGVGTTTSLTLPLTLATTQQLLVQVNGHPYGIPVTTVDRIVRAESSSLSTVGGREVILVDDEPLSLIHLAEILELGYCHACENDNADGRIPVVILADARSRIAFAVDEIVGQQESVVKSLGAQLVRVRNVSGAAILGSGRVVLTLNPSDMMKSARQHVSKRRPGNRAQNTGRANARPRTILVVDDSLTTRNLERSLLEGAGHQVTVASNGSEALEMLRRARCDIVVTDVLMHGMDGYSLTETIRNDPELKDTPVVLVTTLASEADQDRGIEAGASAHIAKNRLDENVLLQVIEQLT